MVFEKDDNKWPTILLVEDDRLYRLGLVEELERAGYTVVQATNCEEARARFRDGIDLAILDYHLPDCTGFCLLDEIRQAQLCYPTLILTAHATDEGASEAKALGASAYLSKPDLVEEVLPVIETLLGAASS